MREFYINKRASDWATDGNMSGRKSGDAIAWGDENPELAIRSIKWRKIRDVVDQQLYDAYNEKRPDKLRIAVLNYLKNKEAYIKSAPHHNQTCDCQDGSTAEEEFYEKLDTHITNNNLKIEYIKITNEFGVKYA